MRTLNCAAGLLAGMLIASGAHAQTAPAPAAPIPVPDATGTRPTQVPTDISGFKLGAGIAVNIDFGGIERISDAEVVAGVVRVKDEDDVRARVMLETHFFFTPKGTKWGVPSGNWGHGPFFAIQPGSDEIIETAALGWMIGFKPTTSSDSFNLGIGIAVDPNVQTLGDGIKRNEALPAGETQIRYREEAQYGLLILFSRTF